MTIYMFWHCPPTVLAAKVANTTLLTYPIQFIDVDNISSGAVTNIRDGNTLLLGTAPGKSDLGRVRVKGNPSGNTINIGFSPIGTHDGELTISVGAYVTVLLEYRIWSKAPRIVTPTDPLSTIPPVIYMDGSEVYGDIPTRPFPVSNVGPSEAGRPDPATGNMYEIKLDVNKSFQFYNSNQGWDSIDDGKFLWQVTGGTIVSGSVTSRQLTVRYPPGVYSIRLDVQSSHTTGAKWHISRKIVFVRDPNNDTVTIPHQITSHVMTPKGQEISAKIFKTMDPDVYRDGSLVMIWEETDYGTSIAQNMIFSGWHSAVQSSIRNERTGGYGDSEFTFLDAAGRLSELPGFTQEMNYKAGPYVDSMGWNFTVYNNVLYYMIFLLYWQSTVLECCDFLVLNWILPLRNFLRLQSEAESLYDQVNHMANYVLPDFYFTTGKLGQLRQTVDPHIMHIQDRDNFSPYIDTLYPDMYTSIEIDMRRTPRVGQLVSGCIESTNVYNTDADGNIIYPTLWCIAPGLNARGQGLEMQQSTNHLADDQFELDYCEGNRYARLNSPWGDVRISAPWNLNFRDYDPGVMGRLHVIADDFVQPPRSFQTTRDFVTLMKEMAISYDYQRTGLLRTVDFTLEIETDGPEAVQTDRPIGINI